MCQLHGPPLFGGGSHPCGAVDPVASATQHTLCAVVLMCSPCRARWGMRLQQLLATTLPPTLKTAVLFDWVEGSEGSTRFLQS